MFNYSDSLVVEVEGGGGQEEVVKNSLPNFRVWTYNRLSTTRPARISLRVHQMSMTVEPRGATIHWLTEWRECGGKKLPVR